MTRAEYTAAARYRLPVVAYGIRYARISAIIARYADGMTLERGVRPTVYVQLELEDVSGKSVTIVDDPKAVDPFDAEMLAAIVGVADGESAG